MPATCILLAIERLSRTGPALSRPLLRASILFPVSAFAWLLERCEQDSSPGHLSLYCSAWSRNRKASAILAEIRVGRGPPSRSDEKFHRRTAFAGKSYPHCGPHP